MRAYLAILFLKIQVQKNEAAVSMARLLLWLAVFPLFCQTWLREEKLQGLGTLKKMKGSNMLTLEDIRV